MISMLNPQRAKVVLVISKVDSTRIQTSAHLSSHGSHYRTSIIRFPPWITGPQTRRSIQHTTAQNGNFKAFGSHQSKD